LTYPNEIYNFVLIDGSKLDYPLKSAVGRSLFANGFERGEIEFLRGSLKPGDIFFDVGANAGLYTVIAAKQIGESGHVYAFEPGECELKLLRHNIAINNLTNVTIIEKAVSNTTGKTQFAISRDGAMNSLLKTDHPQQQIERWQLVELTTLDSFVQELDIKKVDFVKIDVEGAEKLVFEGAKNILTSKNQTVFLFEATDLNANSFGYSQQDLISLLLSRALFVYSLNVSGNLEGISNLTSKIKKKHYNFVASNHSL
jgi:FkbM family methyltransferase